MALHLHERIEQAGSVASQLLSKVVERADVFSDRLVRFTAESELMEDRSSACMHHTQLYSL